MPEATPKKKKVALDIFHENVLPMLSEKYASEDELAKYISDNYEIVDDDGTMIDFKVKRASTPEPGIDEGDIVSKIAKAASDAIEKAVQTASTAIERKFQPQNMDVDIKVGDPRFAQSKTLGFRNMTEFAQHVKNWYIGTDRADERMKYMSNMIMAKAATNVTNEGLGADGGFLLPPEFNAEILRWSFAEESIFERCRKFTTGSNSLTIPRDETTPWGTTGVQAYWTAEAAQITDSKIRVGQDNLVLHKLCVLVPVTDEMIQDSFVGLGAYISELGGSRIRWKVDEAIVNGTGAGKPLGFGNSGALVAVAKETSQTAYTVNLTNLAKMIATIPGDAYRNLLFLIHPSVFPQIVTMTNGYQPLYVAPGQIQGTTSKLGSLFGIPVLVSQHCQALGSQGDIYLVDLSQYIALTKGDGISTDMSIHLYFDYNLTTFRFNFRVAGQPWPKAPIDSAYGTWPLSPFVTLQARTS